MCGLTGFARPNDGDETVLDGVRLALTESMLSIENRGRHATGVSILDAGGKPFVWKVASRSGLVVKSDVWQQVLNKGIDRETIAVIGHTRYATQNNAARDDCAHPFEIGKVVGAHNGIISNWRDIEDDLVKRKILDGSDLGWQVDSQAAFALLDHYKDPRDALTFLDGYFALSWFKNGALYLARSASASLAVAYVPTLRTMFWNSEHRNLHALMVSMGIAKTDYESHEIKADTVYKFKPQSFAAVTNCTKTTAAKSWGSRNISRAQANRWTGNAIGAGELNSPKRARRVYTDGSSWDPHDATQTPATGTSKTYSLREIDDRVDTLYKMVGKLVERAERTERRLAFIQGEYDDLCAALEEQGIDPYAAFDPNVEDVYADEPEMTEPTQDTPDPEQMALTEVLPRVCRVCEKPQSKGHTLYPHAAGGFIGDACLFEGADRLVGRAPVASNK